MLDARSDRTALANGLVMRIVPKIEERNDPANLEKKNGTRNAGSRERRMTCHGYAFSVAHFIYG